MKNVLLFSLCFIFSSLIVSAYETIIIDFPVGENWSKSYYKNIGNEALIQYVPQGESSDLWIRSVVVHSYTDSQYPIKSFSNNMTLKMKKSNPTAPYRTLKLTDSDALFTRCTDDYKNVKAQCEFYRVTKAHNKTVTIHYMDRNKEHFKNNYTLWLEIVRNARFLNSYYRNERTLNKSEYFEL